MSPLTWGDGGSRRLAYESGWRPRPFPLHQHNHREVHSPSRPGMTAWLSGVVWCVSVQRGQVLHWATFFVVVFFRRIFDLVKPLSAQFVPRISSLYSVCNLLLLFCCNSFGVRGNETSPLIEQCITFPFLTHINLNLTEKAYQCTVPSYPRCTEKYEKCRTAQMVKNKNFPAAAASPPHILKLFFSAFFFFFFSCCGSVPLISHQPRSPPWPLLCNSQKRH